MKFENKNPVVIAITILILVIAISGASLSAAVHNLESQISQVGDSAVDIAADADLRATTPKYSEVMTISEAAKYLQVEEGYLRSLMQDSNIPYYEMNGETMFSKTALSRWAAESSESRASY